VPREHGGVIADLVVGYHHHGSEVEHQELRIVFTGDEREASGLVGVIDVGVAKHEPP
jgi:hypothetical protein